MAELIKMHAQENVSVLEFR